MNVSLPVMACFFVSAVAYAQVVAIKPTEKGLRIEVDGALFTEYVVKDTQRPYFYPVIGPNGVGVTREYPTPAGEKFDHVHHSSVWFGHDGVNGLNFWAFPPNSGRVEHTEFRDIHAEANRASFSAKARWTSAKGETVLSDERRFVIVALPDGARQIDLTFTFIASAGDVSFRETKEGAMGIRVAPSIAMPGHKYSADEGRGHILTSTGKRDTEAWGTRGNWVSYYGPDSSGGVVSITMMDHPLNLNHPTWWHVRDYGLFAANPFGKSDFEASREAQKQQATAVEKGVDKVSHTITSGASLTQRYRILIEKGEPAPTKIDRVFDAYSAAR
ncbi:MAG: Methane oxygenase PmoA [Verrucomicrobia bacterium]|nr:MAG: Methane oxygenase PmoA [Verrucomicrobiota bacterium]